MPTELYPEPVIAAIIKNNGKVLLTQSYKWQDRYSIPGGHILDGETVAAALKREVKEEAGVEISKSVLLGVGELIRSPEYYDDLKHFILFLFSVEPSTPEVTLDIEAHNFIWVDPNEVMKMDNVTKWTKVAISYMDGHHSEVIEFEPKP